jgi:hypothetical protein
MNSTCQTCWDLTKGLSFPEWSKLEMAAEAGCQVCALLRDVIIHCDESSNPMPNSRTFWNIFSPYHSPLQLELERVEAFKARIFLSIASGYLLHFTSTYQDAKF